MADWTSIADTEVDPDAPVTSELGYAWRDNPIAIAEGALGAPRVEGRALDVHLGTLNLSGTTAGGFVDLDRHSWLRGDAVSVGGGNFQARYSNNNGSTFGSWQTICGMGNNSVWNGVIKAIFSVRVNLATGAVRAKGWATTGISEAVSAINVSSTTHTVPSNCNAVEFRSSSAGTNLLAVDFDALGGL